MSDLTAPNPARHDPKILWTGLPEPARPGSDSQGSTAKSGRATMPELLAHDLEQIPWLRAWSACLKIRILSSMLYFLLLIPLAPIRPRRSHPSTRKGAVKVISAFERFLSAFYFAAPFLIDKLETWTRTPLF